MKDQRSDANRATVLAYNAQKFREVMDRDGCTELVINAVNSAFIEVRGSWQPVPEIAVECLVSPFVQSLAAYSHAALDRNHPLLSATLPSGERVQVVIPPCVTDFALSIRKPSTLDLTFDVYEREGAFDFSGNSATPEVVEQIDKKIICLLEAASSHCVRQAVELIIARRKTIIISGGTSSGKTTFFNAAAKIISQSERLISIEDTPEITLIQPNHLQLIAQRNSQRATFNTLLEACLRLRPDRILAAELRGPTEAMAFLEGANTGHSGSISTIHSNGTKQTRERLVMMLMRADIGLSRSQILEYLESTVDCFIHFDRGSNAQRSISEITFKGQLFKK